MPNVKLPNTKYMAQGNISQQQQPISQQNFKATNAYFQTMSTEKPMVILNIYFLVPYDKEKAYKTAIEIARSMKATFSGIFLTELPPNYQKAYDYFNFAVDIDSINEVTKRLLSALNLKDDSIRCSIVPYVEAETLAS